MIRTLMATSALALLLSTSAYAQDNTVAPATNNQIAPAQQEVRQPVDEVSFLGSQLMGEQVYNGTADTAENIGDVKDVVIGQNGEIQFVVVGVGGFLGIGEKDIAVAYKDVQWSERNGDRWLVVPFTKDQLTAQAQFDRTPYETAANTTAQAPAASTDTMANAPAATTDTMAPAASTDTTAQAPAAGTDPAATTTMAPAPDGNATTGAIDRSTLKEMPMDNMRAEELVGTTVYGANDANVGEIGDIVLMQDGKADAVIIDVGGFLGMGEKEVAVGMDKLAFMTDQDGNKYLYTNFSKEQLEAQPAYDKSTWAQQRDQQRMMMQ